MLLLNTFSLAEDTISMDNVLDWVQQLNATYPHQFAEIAHELETCDLESELDTVRSSSLHSRWHDNQYLF